MTNKRQSNLIEELKALSTDDEFIRLQDMLGGINFFKISGMGRQETKHSHFLWNLFDPKGVHGWGCDFTKDFFGTVLKGVPLPSNFYTELKTARREYKFNKNESRVDLLVYSNDTVVLIENKVDAGLSKNQLKRYEEGVTFDKHFGKHNKFYIFLTPDGRLPDNDHIKTWKCASYGNIIDSILRMQKRYPPKTQKEQEFNLLLNHYIKFLRNEVIKNVKTLDEETKSLYKSLAEKYPEATAFLGMQRPDEKLALILNEISKILISEKQKRGLILKNGNGFAGECRIQFKTENMTKNLLKKNSDKDNPFLYEFSAEVKKKKVTAYLWPYQADSHDDAVKALIEACASYELQKKHDVIKSRNIDFALEIDIEEMAEKLQTDNYELTKIVLGFLDEIKNVENKIKETLE